MFSLIKITSVHKYSYMNKTTINRSMPGREEDF